MFLSAALACYSFGSSQTTFEEISADLNKAGGVYFAYPAPTAKLTAAPKGYKPFYISHYGRHGSRYVLGNGDCEYTIGLMEKAQEQGCLTTLGADALQRVRTLYKEIKDHGGDLTPLGERQHKGIARRMYQNFPEVFKGKGSVYARSTVVYRCAMSMTAFATELKGLAPQLDMTCEMNESNMAYLNYHTDKSNRFTNGENGPWVEEYKKFEAEHINATRLAESLFSNSQFIRRNVNLEKLVWSLYWIAVDVQDMETQVSLYDLFTPQELFDLWQCVNYKFYICNANPAMNQGLTMANASTLVENILDCADKAIEGNGTVADLRFGHDGNVIPLLALLQVNGYDAAVWGPEDLYKHWTDFKVTPMAANLQIVFYKNSKDDVLVKFLHNETEAHIAVETDQWPYYKWTDVEKYYRDRLSTLKAQVEKLK